MSINFEGVRLCDLCNVQITRHESRCGDCRTKVKCWCCGKYIEKNDAIPYRGCYHCKDCCDARRRDSGIEYNNIGVSYEL